MNEPNVAVNITGLDFRQDVEPLIKEFFPLLYNEAGAVNINFNLTEDDMSLSVDGPEGQGAGVISEPFSSEEEKPKLRHRAYRNQLLRALYRLLSEYTGKTLPWGTLTGV